MGWPESCKCAGGTHGRVAFMHAAPESMRELFADNALYVIPRFQRRYAWTSENWDQLWTDVVTIVDGYTGTGDPPRLFLGAIVVAADAEAPHQLHQVVDGQQRLITVQLLAA